VISAYSAHRRRETHWFGLLAFLFVYWLAFLINASFDVFLEGPVGGIWFWCVYGMGIGSVWVYRNCPESLAAPKIAAPAPASSKRSRAIKETLAVCAS
jgi:hypothetical protein